jgi:hypothetical protein
LSCFITPPGIEISPLITLPRSFHLRLSPDADFYRSYQKEIIMTIQSILKILNARAVNPIREPSGDIQYGFASDLMSDVLTLDSHNVALITGLANIQVVRTAEMSEIPLIILVRNKKATPEMLELATENGIALIEYHGSMFRAVSLLAGAGMQAVY